LGQISSTKIGVLIVCLLTTGVLIRWQPSPVRADKKAELRQALAYIEGWQLISHAELDPGVINALELDEYANGAFSNGKANVNLYVGYYHTSKKVGAAHSPLVCYPGQGWILSDRANEDISVKGSEVHLARLIASRGEVRHLVIYWFQSYDKTSPGTFSQKIKIILAKIMRKKEDNAFVRISISLDGRTVEEAYDIGVKFIQSFYPVLLNYIKV
jgi:EpsI family protein